MCGRVLRYIYEKMSFSRKIFLLFCVFDLCCSGDVQAGQGLDFDRASDALLGTWVKDVKRSKYLCVFDDDALKGRKVAIEVRGLDLTPKNIEKISIKPLKAIFAEGGDMYVVFLDQRGSVISVYFVNALVNSLYNDGWQIRPVDYVIKDGKISKLSKKSLASEGVNYTLFLDFGSAFDKIVIDHMKKREACFEN